MVKSVEEEDEAQDAIKLEGIISEIFRIRQIRTNFFSLMTILTSSSFCYFLIGFQMKVVPGNLVYLTMVSQLSDAVANFQSGFLYKKTGPRLGFFSMFTLSSVGSLCLLLLWNQSPYLILCFIILAKLGITSAFNMAFISFMQLIPTILCSTVFGFCNVTARVATVLSSQVAEIDPFTAISINLGFVALSIIASAFLISKLPKF